jgi:hypothetical protein
MEVSIGITTYTQIRRVSENTYIIDVMSVFTG